MITIEVLAVFPALFVLLMFLVQVALIYFAKQAALAAAEQGMHVAAAGATVQDPYAGMAQGQQAARDFASTTASNIFVVTNVTTPAAPPANQIQITVTGKVTSLIPTITINLNVSQTAIGSVEKFSSAGNP